MVNMVRFLALLVTLSLFPSAQGIKIGAITYWNDASAYNTLPANSFAIINPDDGIIKASSADVKKFGNIISTIKSTIPSVTLFGYVPTGYGDRNKQPYATIKAQVKAYFGNYSKLDGIFYDETDGGCAGTKNDLPQFRKFVQDIKKNGLITYNPGWVGSNWCYLNYSQSGEIVMDFESPYKNYNKSASDLKEAKTIAKSRGIRTWHVIYNVTSQSDMQTVMNMAKNNYTADYVYIAENNRYDKPPSYWDAEKKAASA